MLTIFTPKITDRIRFIMNVIFKEHLDIPYLLTDSVSESYNAKIKISYAPSPIDNEIFIWQHPLLQETEIKEQNIDAGYFEGETIFFQSPSNNSFLPFDIFAFSFFLLSRYEEYLPYKKDKYNRFPGTESLAYKLDFIQKPLVDILILKFAKKLQEAIPELKYNLAQPEYIATYDIDNAYAYKYKGLIRSLGGLLRPLIHFDFKEVSDRILTLLNLKKDPFDTYEYIKSLQEKYHLKNYYFILFSEKSTYDRGLNPKNKHFHHLIKQLNLNGEIGIHPSFASSGKEEKLKQEVTGLSSVLQKKVTLSRSHFLLLEFPGTYQKYIANGIEADFTLGYADQAGFRASSCKPYYFFDLSTNKETSLKLYPLTYMDGTLQGYMQLTKIEGLNLIKQLIDSVKSVNGTFISLWHNETLGRKEWIEWKNAYEESLIYYFKNIKTCLISNHNMKKRIIICVINDLCTDQRVQKVSLSLHGAGFDILLVGRKQKDSLPFNAPYSHKRLRLIFSKTALFYAEINIRLFFLLLFSKVDIILSNDTDTILPAYLISKIRNKKLVFDAHELFPEMPELADRKLIKNTWINIENWIFPKIKNSYTVCDSIANYYHEKYNINMEVIRNVPHLRNIEKTNRKELFSEKKILLYQGAVNIGRGLEWVIDCMPLLDNCILIIVGNGDIFEELKKKVEQLHLQENVYFLGRMSPNDLFNYTIAADIGLCLLENKGLNYYYALPNRIFDFIQAETPILATNFPEIANIVEKYDTGVLVNHYEPAYLSKVITEMLAVGKLPYAERLNKLSHKFCWENEEKKLLNIFNNL